MIPLYIQVNMAKEAENMRFNDVQGGWHISWQHFKGPLWIVYVKACATLCVYSIYNVFCKMWCEIKHDGLYRQVYLDREKNI